MRLEIGAVQSEQAKSVFERKSQAVVIARSGRVARRPQVSLFFFWLELAYEVEYARVLRFV